MSRIIAEQYERAKQILREHSDGHAELADTLVNREVIFTEDVQRIFGPRKWVSRTQEIIQANTPVPPEYTPYTDVTDTPAQSDEDKTSAGDDDTDKDNNQQTSHQDK